MNKIVKCMCMMAVVALAFASCKKQNDVNTQSFAFNGSTEQFVSDEGSFERAYLDGLTVKFEPGDQMEIFNIVNLTGGSQAALYEVTANMTLDNLSGEVSGTTNGRYYAFYPGNNVKTNLSNENYASFHLDPVQIHRADADGNPIIPQAIDSKNPTLRQTALYMAAKDETATALPSAYFDFKNICGMLSMKFYSPDGKIVQSIELTDRKYNLVGDVHLKIHEVDPVKLTTFFRNIDSHPAELPGYLADLGYYVDGDKSNTITLDCTNNGATNGVELGRTKEEATRFFMVLRPLALQGGCDITIHFYNEDDVVIHSSRDNRISPNVIRNIAAYNVD